MCDKDVCVTAAGPIVATWRKGQILLGKEPEGDPSDAALFAVDHHGDGEGPSVLLTLRLQPVMQRLAELGADAPVVQSFRMYGTDGSPRRFTWCADCGHTMICDAYELRKDWGHKCRKCGAKTSVVVCEAWHAFGSCKLCRHRLPSQAKTTAAKTPPPPRAGPGNPGPVPVQHSTGQLDAVA